MKKILIFTACLLIPALSSQAKTIEEIAASEVVDNEAVKVYGGKVGKLPAVFFIEWASDQIFGHYYHPSKGKKNTYQLQGTNPKQGVLILNEMTQQKDGSNKKSATIKLKKKVVNGKIVWAGTMFNTDGRKFPVSFSRAK